jgi:hypothetical protein
MENGQDIPFTIYSSALCLIPVSTTCKFVIVSILVFISQDSSVSRVFGCMWTSLFQSATGQAFVSLSLQKCLWKGRKELKRCSQASLSFCLHFGDFLFSHSLFRVLQAKGVINFCLSHPVMYDINQSEMVFYPTQCIY